MYFFASRSAASTDSEPEQAKKVRFKGSGVSSAIFMASMTSDGAEKLDPVWMILRACSQTASTYSGWEWPRVRQSCPDWKSM